MKLLALVAFVSAAFLAGCGSIPMQKHRMYSSDAPPSGGEARLVRGYNTTAKITAIDGITTPTEADGYLASSFLYELLPGNHTVQCSFERGSEFGFMTLVNRSSADKTVSFNAKAGETYYVHGGFDGYVPKDWAPEIYRIDGRLPVRVTSSPFAPLRTASEADRYLRGKNLWGNSTLYRETKANP